MKRIALILSYVLFFLYIGLNINYSAEVPANVKNLEKELQRELDKLQQTEGFPGVTLGIVLPDGQEINLASGLADLESKIKMKPTDRIMMGSIGKTYVASVALQLIGEKKFSLEDKVSRYLGKEDWFDKLPNGKDITIGMLMNHTGGLPRYVFKEPFWKQFRESPGREWKPEELLSFILGDKPIHPAGKGWSYSDTDYIVLGMIIERVTGHKYYEELKKRILEPLGLKDTIPQDKRRLPGLVPGYSGDKTPPFYLPAKTVVDGEFVINPQFEWTGGGLITHSLDLAKFFKLLLEGKIVSGEYLELMKRPVEEETGKPGQVGYGLGLEVWSTVDGTAYGHRGTMPGYGSIAEYVPRYGFSIAIQYNTDGLSGRLNKSRTRNDYIAVLKPIIIDYLKQKK